MKTTWKYFGAESEIAGVASLKTLGQAVELDAEINNDHPALSIPILPAKEFDLLGFTPDELSKYARFTSRGGASDEFHAKIRRASLRLTELRDQFLLKPANPEPPAPVVIDNGGDE